MAKRNIPPNERKLYYYGKRFDEVTINLIQDLKKLGFNNPKITDKYPNIKFNRDGVGCGAYIGPNFVVKDSCIMGAKPPKRVMCPTTKMRNGWMIQPKCVVFSTLTQEEKTHYEELGMVERDCDDDYMLKNAGEDPHENNFGLLDGKLVQFDW